MTDHTKPITASGAELDEYGLDYARPRIGAEGDESYRERIECLRRSEELRTAAERANPRFDEFLARAIGEAKRTLRARGLSASEIDAHLVRFMRTV